MSGAEAPNPAFAAVDLLSAELELTSSIHEGFSTAIMVREQPRMIALFREYADAVQVMAIIERARGAVAEDAEARCPICSKDIRSDDMCLDDIEMGACHAACLEGAPAVDLDTGKPLPADAHAPQPYRYGDQ